MSLNEKCAVDEIRRLVLRCLAVVVALQVLSGVISVLVCLSLGCDRKARLSPSEDSAGPQVAVVDNSSRAEANGNRVTVEVPGVDLPASQRTVQQVADYLGVTGDTVRESYIPEWIAAGHMVPGDKVRNRWVIPEGFVPYRPK